MDTHPNSTQAILLSTALLFSTMCYATTSSRAAKTNLHNAVAQLSAQPSCGFSFPQRPFQAGTRVVFVTSNSSDADGAQVYLGSNCQGFIKQEQPNREAYSLMVANVPPGNYTVTVKKQGYADFQTDVSVLASNEEESAPKVTVRFALRKAM